MKEAADPSGLDPYEDGETRLKAQRMGMWLFLATEAMIFAGLFLSLFVIRTLHPEGAAEASSHLKPMVGAGNTAILIIASTLVALSSVAAKDGDERRFITWAGFAGAALLGALFLAIKIGVEYRAEFHEGFIPGAGPAFPIQADGAQLFFNLYFAATALHAVHVLIGVLVLAGAALGVWRRWLKLPDNAPEIEFCGLYWHLVDIIWIFLFPVLYLVG
ncbi:MAG: cytochrome c oxidase subunit 3 [Oceanicaulis sp.]